MKLAFAAVVLAVAASAARLESTARAEPLARERVFPNVELGLSLPLLGNIGTIPVAGTGYFAGGITGYAMARADRFALRIEGEFDELWTDQADGTFARVGVAGRVQLWRFGGRWTDSALEQRFAFDLFVEAGVGKEWITPPGLAPVQRRDVELAIGMDPAVWLRRFGGRATYVGTFYRLRTMLASSPMATSGVDVALMFDMGFAFGR